MAHDDHGMLSRRRGLTLVEILVVLAIGLVLAVAVLPGIIGSVDEARVDESAESLEGIVEAMTSMWEDTQRFPGLLTHLTTPIAAGDSDICGTNYGGDAASWAGPYLNRTIPTSGLVLPIGVARNTLSYTASPPLLRIHVDSVSHEDARTMNAAVDADADSIGGAVRWGPVSGSGLVELFYVRPVPSC